MESASNVIVYTLYECKHSLHMHEHCLPRSVPMHNCDVDGEYDGVDRHYFNCNKNDVAK